MTRLYIVFNHALFGQGIRSLLQGRRSIQIVGMAKKDEAKSMKALEAARPEVIILEESNQGITDSALAGILKQSSVRRVIELDLAHNYTTVYEWRRIENTNPDDLVEAIREGWGKCNSGSKKIAARARPARTRLRPPDPVERRRMAERGE